MVCLGHLTHDFGVHFLNYVLLCILCTSMCFLILPCASCEFLIHAFQLPSLLFTDAVGLLLQLDATLTKFLGVAL